MSSETDIIEEKKNITSNSTDNWSLFTNGIISTIVYIILTVWILGTCLLYSTKVSKSNIIPTDFNNINSQPINLVNANYVRELIISTEKPYISIGKYTAQEWEFFRDDPSILERILNYFKPNDGNSSILYESLKKIFTINNSVVTKIYSSLYGLNESLLMVFSPFIYFFIFIFYSIFCFWGIFYYQMYGIIKLLMFSNGDKNNTYFWSNMHPVLNFILFPLYLYIAVVFSFFTSFISSLFSVPYSFLSFLGYKYHLTTDGNSNEKPEYGFLTLLNSFMKYKVSLVMIIISLSVLSNSNMYLGNAYIAGSVLAIIILAFLGIYNYVSDPLDKSQITRIVKKFKS